MFTGIIEAIGSVRNIERHGSDVRLVIDAGKLDLSDIKPGDSISVSGVCLTVVAISGTSIGFDVSAESLSRTTLGDLRPDSQINLEKALLPTTRLGGHLVSGHVDGVGKIISRNDAGESIRFTIEVPKKLTRYIAEKGSICVEGVSLTVNVVDGSSFSVNIVPHTQTVTTLKAWRTGTRVNLEVDLLARYLERLVAGETEETKTGITREFLVRHGILK